MFALALSGLSVAVVMIAASGNVSPPLVADHLTDNASGDREFVSQGPLANSAGRISSANFTNIGFGEFCMSTALATVCRARSLGHVLHVVDMGSDSQMRRIHAEGIVAFVQDIKATGDWTTVRQFPRDTVSGEIASLTLPLADVSVPIGHLSASPKDAPFWSRRTQFAVKRFAYGDTARCAFALSRTEQTPSCSYLRCIGPEAFVTVFACADNAWGVLTWHCVLPFAQVNIRGMGFGDLAIAVVILAAVIGLVYVALRKFGVQIPDWVMQCFWIVIVAVVVIFCIRFVMSL